MGSSGVQGIASGRLNDTVSHPGDGYAGRSVDLDV